MLGWFRRLGASGSYFWLALAVVLASYLARLASLGLEYPVPWPDEGSFLWQALGFTEHGTLFAPQLNPDRHVLWMQPGYMLVQGVLFWFTGFSLQWARSLSGLFMAGAALSVMVAVHRRELRWVQLLSLAVFLHTPIFLMAGNTARMEALVWLCGAATLLLLAKGHIRAGWALVSLAPLVHPNGVFFVLAALLHGGVRLVREPELRGSIRPWLAAASIPLLAWLAYTVYVTLHWDAFQHDMLMQLGMKSSPFRLGGGPLGRLSEVPILCGLIGCVLGVAQGVRRGRSFVFLFAWILPLFLLAILSVGWLYDLYPAVGWFLLCLACAEMGLDLGRGLRVSKRWAVFLGGLAGVLSISLAATWLWSPSALNSTPDRTIVKLGPAAPEYFNAGDAESVGRYLNELRESERPFTVQFLPWSDALLFRRYEGGNLRFLQPTFTQRSSDVVIVHRSVHIPPKLWHKIVLRVSFVAKIQVPMESWRVIRSRDGTEHWLAYRRDDGGA